MWMRLKLSMLRQGDNELENCLESLSILNWKSPTSWRKGLNGSIKGLSSEFNSFKGMWELHPQNKNPKSQDALNPKVFTWLGIHRWAGTGSTCQSWTSCGCWSACVSGGSSTSTPRPSSRASGKSTTSRWWGSCASPGPRYTPFCVFQSCTVSSSEKEASLSSSERFQNARFELKPLDGLEYIKPLVHEISKNMF